MLKSRLFWRLFMTYATLTVVSMSVVVAVVVRQSRELAITFTRESLLREANYVRGEAMALARGAPGARERLMELARQSGRQVQVVVLPSNLIFDSQNTGVAATEAATATSPAADNHVGSSEVSTADWKDLQAVPAEGYGVAVDPPEVYVSVLASGVEAPIAVRLHASYLEAWEALTPSQELLGTLFPAVIVLVIGSTLLVVARIVQPLNDLTVAADAIAKGDLSQSVETRGDDEVARLGLAFNTMSQEVVSRVEELKRQGRQLQETRDRLAAVLEGMVEGVIALDAQERIIFANEAAYQLVEFSQSRANGKRVWEVIRNSTVQEVIRRLYAGVPQSRMEFVLPRSRSTVELFASRLAGDPCPGVVLVLHDVSEIRRLERLRRDFVTNVSHELKTPLAAIQGYADTLLDGGALEDPPAAEHFVRRLREQADRLHTLILDVLQIARVESGQETFEEELVPLADVVADVLQSSEAMALQRSITIVSQPPRHPVAVRADREGVRTILDNLVSNALKYSPEGRQVEVAWEPQEQWVELRVIDQGDGIPAEQHERIFERFYRVDAARSRDLGGTGLGLSIVKHLCQMFGGTVGVESELGRGASFWVRLPRADFAAGNTANSVGKA